MAIEKLNRTFVDGEVWDASDINPISSKIDEVIEEVNSHTSQLSNLNFGGRYLGPYSEPPTTDPNGDPLLEGDVYWDTTQKKHFVWDGDEWVVVLNNQINDSVIAENTTWSSQKIDNEKASIDDENISDKTTWSSKKIDSSIIRNVNQPVITGPNSAKYDTTITLTALGSLSAFKDNGAVIDHYEWILPDNSTETGNSINYTMPDNSHLGEVLTFKCRAVDSLGNVSSWSEFTVEVSDNLPPEISSIDRSDVLMEGNSYTFTINASDPEGSSLQYKITCNDPKVTISPSDWSSGNSFTVTLPDYESDTPVVFIYHVSDGTSEVTQGEQRVIYNNTTILAKIEDASTSSGYSYEVKVTTDKNGNIFIAGENNDRDNCIIIKLNSRFNILGYIGITGDGTDFGIYGVTTDSEGNVFVCGRYSSNGLVIKLTNDLTFVKAITVSNRFRDIVVDSNDNVFVCGWYYDGNNYYFAIIKFDNDLNSLKQITINTGGSNDELYGIAVDNNNNIFVCGGYYDSDVNHRIGFIAKLDYDLNNILNQITIDQGSDLNFQDIAVDNNNNIFVSGALFVKCDNNLNVVKQITTNNSTSYLTLDSDNNVIVGGMVDQNFTISKLDTSLNPIKGIKIDGGDSESCYSLTCIGKDIIACGQDKSSPFKILVGKFHDFDNYDSFYKYLIGSNVYVKQDVALSVTEQNYSPVTRSWSIVNQNWTVNTPSFQVADVNFYIIKGLET